MQCTAKMPPLWAVHVLSRWPIFRQDMHTCASVIIMLKRICACVHVSVEHTVKVFVFLSTCIIWEFDPNIGSRRIFVYLCVHLFVCNALQRSLGSARLVKMAHLSAGQAHLSFFFMFKRICAYLSVWSIQEMFHLFLSVCIVNLTHL